MSNVYHIEQPTKANAVLDPQMVIMRPIYAQKQAIAKMLGVSGSTVYRLMKETEKQEVEDVFINVSSTLTLVHKENFVTWLKSLNKKYL